MVLHLEIQEEGAKAWTKESVLIWEHSPGMQDWAPWQGCKETMQARNWHGSGKLEENNGLHQVK